MNVRMLFTLVSYLCLGISFGCNSQQEDASLVRGEPKRSIVESVDFLASKEQNKFLKMTDKGIFEYLEALGKGYLSSQINNPTPFNQEIAQLASGNFLSSVLLQKDGLVNRGVAERLLAIVDADENYFVPGNNLFFASEEIEDIEFFSDIEASVKFSHSAIDLKYKFLKRDREWFFDGFLGNPQTKQPFPEDKGE